jgi:energy-coupling factor transporter ATP-binding protein EcfA2
MIQAKGVDYVYPSGKQALSGINLEVARGEFVAVVGHNGSGKSTLAGLLAGLEKPTRGQIIVDGINTRDKKNFLPLRKKVGMVFQNPENQLVFEKVKDDIGFGLKNIGFPQAEIETRTAEISRKMRIESFTGSLNFLWGRNSALP